MTIQISGEDTPPLLNIAISMRSSIMSYLALNLRKKTAEIKFQFKGCSKQHSVKLVN